MTKNEVMQLALDALDEACEIVGSAWAWRDEKGRPAANALRTALAQPEHEPVGWMYTEVGMDENRVVSSKILLRDYDTGVGIPLYTVPPQREWVGLTDDEKQVCYWFECPAGADPSLFAERIEKRLKEKNT